MQLTAFNTAVTTGLMGELEPELLLDRHPREPLPRCHGANRRCVDVFRLWGGFASSWVRRVIFTHHYCPFSVGFMIAMS